MAPDQRNEAEEHGAKRNPLSGGQGPPYPSIRAEEFNPEATEWIGQQVEQDAISPAQSRPKLPDDPGEQ